MLLFDIQISADFEEIEFINLQVNTIKIVKKLFIYNQNSVHTLYYILKIVEDFQSFGEV